MCDIAVFIWTLSTFLQLDFGSVLTVWCFLIYYAEKTIKYIEQNFVGIFLG